MPMPTTGPADHCKIDVFDDASSNTLMILTCRNILLNGAAHWQSFFHRMIEERWHLVSLSHS